MKIIMLVEYFYPFDRGGAEISTLFIAKQLSRKHKIIILTPNYGSNKEEYKDEIKIIRLPFYRKLNNKKAFINPIFTNNIFWFIYSALQIYKISKKEKVDIIHIQSKSFIVGAYMANLILRKPMVVTFRDYQPICNLGFCLLKKDKSCNIFEYLLLDIPYFLKNYNNNLLLQRFYFPVLAIRARLMDKLINIAAKSIKYKICISYRQREIFTKNGFKNINVIHNTSDFKKVSKKKINKIIYVGKLTPAKGILPIVKELLKTKAINFKVQIVGKGILESKIRNLIQKSPSRNKFEMLPYLEHDQVLKEIAEAKLIIIPSIWQEPFGRVAIEALSVATPLVVNSVGGLPEIVKNNVYGCVVSLKPKVFVKAITDVYKNSTYFQKIIIKDYKDIHYKYYEEPILKYEVLYRKMLIK